MIEKLKSLHSELNSVVLGSELPATLLITALLAKGHALIEGAPGVGKTSLAQSLASGMSGVFKRIQFTPDLLPSDILGYQMYRQQRDEFEFIPGPIFTNLLLADEINRTSPRVQSALLEAMNEGQVSIDGVTRQLEAPFMVVATQNVSSSTGTFPLPEAQLDRFLLSIPMHLPDAQVQVNILRSHLTNSTRESLHDSDLSLADWRQLQAETMQLPVAGKLSQYIVDLCESVRVVLGSRESVSVRASLAIMRAAQAYAKFSGHSELHPDHIQLVYPHVLSHRLITDSQSSPETVLQAALEQTPVP
ncbi:AAA family ATPase [Persicirhabdus sediminis]|uniref:AAA family ATPase n=1 Tax=Persicirhabdus sediminis TaxID=454144 RepID=A0A8J7SM87_9BACT|nr:AAA family ATPase [Persicirhabdus sediminis]MBK1792821.1 AAA family ATPase [Persicirhabdus sediminis]